MSPCQRLTRVNQCMHVASKAGSSKTRRHDAWLVPLNTASAILTIGFVIRILTVAMILIL